MIFVFDKNNNTYKFEKTKQILIYKKNIFIYYYIIY